MNEHVPNCLESMPVPLLTSWYDHRLDSPLSGEVQSHITTCSACQSYLAAYQNMSHLPQSDNSPDIQEQVCGSIQQQKKRNRSLFVFVAASSAVIAIVMVCVAVFAIWPKSRGGTPISSKTTATIQPTQIPTVETFKSDPAQGWVSIPALNFGTDIAFSSDNPFTGYVCGKTVPSIAGKGATILFTVTHDGGRTWSLPNATPLSNRICTISINPNNWKDVLLSGYDFGQASGLSIPINEKYYRSLDEGMTWEQLIFPAGYQGNDSISAASMWAGSTLFIMWHDQTHSLLAKSVNNGPLQWADTNTPFNGTVTDMYSIGTVAYVLYHDQNYQNRIAKTSDNGETWSTFIPQGLSPEVAFYPTVAGKGDRIFVVTGAVAHLAASSDNGQTWTYLPSFPSNLQLSGNIDDHGIISTPDGRIYVRLYNLNSNADYSNAYVLVPGGTSWIPLNGIDYFIAISWGTDGHAIAAWKLKPPDASTPVGIDTDIPPGLQDHGIES
jgi:hypothetical protein